MEAGAQDFHECFADDVQVAQGEVAFVKLAIVELVEDGVANDLLNIVLADGAAGELGGGGGFDGVREHDDGGFDALGLGAGITVVLNADGFLRFAAFERLLRLDVEVADERGAVMLADEVDDAFGNAMLGGELDAFLHVVLDDEGGHLGLQRGVAHLVFVGDLVFGEIFGLGGFSDVVIEASGANEEVADADFSGGGFGELCDVEGVLPGAGRPFLNEAQERMMQAREFEQLHVRHDAETFERGKNREDEETCDAGNETEAHGGDGDVVGVADECGDDNDGGVGNADGDAGDEDLPALADGVEHRNAGVAAEEADDDELVVEVDLQAEEQTPPGDEEERHAHVQQEDAKHTNGACGKQVAHDVGVSLRKQQHERLNSEGDDDGERNEDRGVGGEDQIAAELVNEEGNDDEHDEDEGRMAAKAHAVADFHGLAVGGKKGGLLCGDSPLGRCGIDEHLSGAVGGG